MPGANASTTPIGLDLDFIVSRPTTLGDYTVCFESHHQDNDPAAYFAGLPDDRCQCPHWGVVTAGRVTFRFADHLETFEAGDAYYVPPGHLPILTAGTSVIEFSPTAELQQTMAVVGANLEATMSDA